MRKLMLCALAVVMVTVAFSGVALAAKRPGPQPQAGIEDIEVIKVPSYDTSTTLNGYAGLPIPPAPVSAKGKPFGAGHEGDTFIHLLLGLTPLGVLKFAFGVTTPVETADTACTSISPGGFSGEAAIEVPVLAFLDLSKVMSASAVPTAAVFSLSSSASVLTVEQILGPPPACPD